MAERIVETPLTGREIKEILKQDYAAALERAGIGESETYDSFGHSMKDVLWMRNRSGFGSRETTAWAETPGKQPEGAEKSLVLEERTAGTPTEERIEHDMEVTLEHTVTKQRRQGKAKRMVQQEAEEERP